MFALASGVLTHNSNPMPESVTDRPTKSHEYLFLLSKSKTYYYDADAVREESLGTWNEGGFRNSDNHEYLTGGKPTQSEKVAGRNRRTVWSIPTAPYSGAHFATYPPALVEPCIKAGTSERGCCPECGAGWVRVVEKPKPPDEMYVNTRKPKEIQAVWNTGGMGQKLQNWYNENPTQTTGWRPTCDCCQICDHYNRLHGDNPCKPYEPIPCTVLDPFAGSGTTLLVARALGRHGVGLDLSSEYLQLARERLSLTALEEWEHGKKDGKGDITELPLFGGFGV